MINDLYGARVYKLDQDRILVKQTIKKENRINSSERYVIDTLEDGAHKENHVDINDDKAIAYVIRQALNGKL